MKRIAGLTVAAGLAAAMLLGPLAATAQDRGGERGDRGQSVRGRRGGEGGQRGDRGGMRGGFDMEQMRERMLQRYQERLGMKDDEWSVVKPLLADVQEKQMAARMGGMRGFFGGRGRGGPRGDRGGEAAAADNPAAQLQQALEDEKTPASEIQAKLKALRDARKKAEEELKAAREKLRKVLTIRQEAQLVLMGTLD